MDRFSFKIRVHPCLMFVRKSPDSEEAKNKHVDDTKAVIDEVADEGALL